ncbi:hypothetical protein M758_UG310400 [Ceratodon purpureus]|nr:hypothetical protein M758_UG310400 [Ceratodon purpureus]
MRERREGVLRIPPPYSLQKKPSSPTVTESQDRGFGSEEGMAELPDNARTRPTNHVEGDAGLASQNIAMHFTGIVEYDPGHGHGTVHAPSTVPLPSTTEVPENKNSEGFERIRVHFYIGCKTDRKKKIPEKDSPREDRISRVSDKLKGTNADESEIDVTDDEDEENKAHLIHALTEDANNDDLQCNALVGEIVQSRAGGLGISSGRYGIGAFSRSLAMTILTPPSRNGST